MYLKIPETTINLFLLMQSYSSEVDFGTGTTEIL